jgi:hypothetical protein
MLYWVQVGDRRQKNTYMALERVFERIINRVNSVHHYCISLNMTRGAGPCVPCPPESHYCSPLFLSHFFHCCWVPPRQWHNFFAPFTAKGGPQRQGLFSLLDFFSSDELVRTEANWKWEKTWSSMENYKLYINRKLLMRRMWWNNFYSIWCIMIHSHLKRRELGEKWNWSIETELM